MAAGPGRGAGAGWPRCEAAGVRARRIAVDYASHTGQVEVLRGELAELGAGVTARGPVIPFVLDGDRAVAGRAARPGVLVREPAPPGPVCRRRGRAGRGRVPVLHRGQCPPRPDRPHRRHRTAAATSSGSGSGGSRPAGGSGPAGGAGVTVTGTLRRGDGGPARLLHSAASLWTAGRPRHLAGGVRRVGCPAGGPADLPVPAAAVLAGGRGAGW